MTLCPNCVDLNLHHNTMLTNLLHNPVIALQQRRIAYHVRYLEPCHTSLRTSLTVPCSSTALLLAGGTCMTLLANGVTSRGVIRDYCPGRRLRQAISHLRPCVHYYSIYTFLECEYISLPHNVNVKSC